MRESELKKILWEIICEEGIIVDNQNIDWLIGRAYKEYAKRVQEVEVKK